MKRTHTMCSWSAGELARPVRREAARRPPADKAGTGASPPTHPEALQCWLPRGMRRRPRGRAALPKVVRLGGARVVVRCPVKEKRRCH